MEATALVIYLSSENCQFMSFDRVKIRLSVPYAFWMLNACQRHDLQIFFPLSSFPLISREVLSSIVSVRFRSLVCCEFIFTSGTRKDTAHSLAQILFP